MTIAEMIRPALEQKGLHGLKEASKALGISSELLRIILNRGHIPKDKTLVKIAGKLGIGAAALILAAHRQRVPAEMRGYLLSPAPEKTWRQKRVFPLSEEQCNYLGKIMNKDEIQIVRKFRQVLEEAQVQVVGYVDYMFASERKTPVPAPADQEAPQNAA